MAKPHIHALSSVRSFGGLEEDYLPIHEFLDSSKAIVADNRHRAFTHNSWFINTVIPRVLELRLQTQTEKSFLLV